MEGAVAPLVDGAAYLRLLQQKRSESDGRYFSNTDYAPLDFRYHVVNGNAGGGGIIPMVLENFTHFTPYYTSTQVDSAITAALAQVDSAISAAPAPYSTTVQMDAAIAAAVAGLDLSPYNTAAQTDAAIAVALVPVTLSNAPAWVENFTPRMIRALLSQRPGGEPDPRQLRHGAADLQLLLQG